VGTRVAVTEPPFHLVLPSQSAGVLVADPSALGVVLSLLDALDPRVWATVLLVDDHADRDHIPLPTRDNATISWVDTLAAADLRGATASLDPTNCWLWAAGERALAKTVREFTRAEFPVPRAAQHIQTYWVR
jgi:NADPH-dependent ferric siderophore reductase